MSWSQEMELTKKLNTITNLGLRNVAWLIIGRLLARPAFTFFERFGIHVMRVHYFSPVPDTRELRKDFHLWYREWSFTGVDFNLEEQLKLLQALQRDKLGYDKLPPYDEIASKGFGLGYGEIESHILHAMVRYFKPQSLVEVGSGVSTVFSANALSLNKKETGKDAKMTCIEPYPSSPLRELTKDHSIELIAKRVQEVDWAFFKSLRRGDILFIDSTHTVKINSDVNFLYLEVLPNLNEGVVIAIDDIPFPYPTLEPEHWIFRGHRFWTEPALLHAFLTFNTAFKILLCPSYLHHKQPETLATAFSVYDPQKHSPSAIWLQKVR
jgi:Methyltransferase domain